MAQVSIIMSVLFYAIRPCNDLDTIVANGRKQTVLHLFLDAALKTVAYLRVSTRSQDLANQKPAILEFSQKRRFPIDQFIESRISSRQSPLERRIEELLAALEPGDRLLVSELSRLGRIGSRSKSTAQQRFAADAGTVSLCRRASET